MGKKYIIELLDDCPSEFKGIIVFGMTPSNQISVEMIPAEDLTPYTGPDFEQVRKEAYEKGWKEAEDHYFDGYSNGYDAGLDDAWKAARKIWEYDTTTLMGIFGEGIMRRDWFMKLTAAEAIEKIWQYEQKKEDRIQIGDEVTPIETEYDDMIVTRLWKDDYDSDCIDAIGFDGRIGSFLVSRVSKTGKHYEIAEVFEKMRGEQDGKRREE